MRNNRDEFAFSGTIVSGMLMLRLLIPLLTSQGFPFTDMSSDNNPCPPRAPRLSVIERIPRPTICGAGIRGLGHGLAFFGRYYSDLRRSP